MKDIDIRKQTHGASGTWNAASDQIEISNVKKRNIYRSPEEPSFVCWPILWKESDGTLKVSFTEATGDMAGWPPVYNFNSNKLEYYLKTLISENLGETWKDTGWRENLDPFWVRNSDHHIRHVFQIQDGTILRNYCHALDGVTENGHRIIYDESKTMETFPFTLRDAEVHPKFTSTWKSADGGRTWEEIHINRAEPSFFASGIHPLRSGSIIATGGCGGNRIAITESWDGGRTWSPLQCFGNDRDPIAPEGLSEEMDFVELQDGRLLLIVRTCGMGINHQQMYLSRDKSGRWHASEPSTRPQFPLSGYPYMYRACDETIFYYDDTALRYTCDDGETWHSLPLGYAYYGQLVEATPGHIVSITQMNIGDCAYPWKHDTAMMQTSFDYRRTGVVEQTEAAGSAATATLGETQYGDFHLYAQIRADGETGLIFSADGDSYWFAALVIPCNKFRAPGKAEKGEQDSALVLGRCEAGRITVLRRVYTSKIAPGSWIEMQIDRKGNILKAAVKFSNEDWSTGKFPAVYNVLCGDFGKGKIGLFTNRSTGAFRNVRIGTGGLDIRSNWYSSEEAAIHLPLDAGQQK